jgi:hypothetical protein
MKDFFSSWIGTLVRASYVLFSHRSKKLTHDWLDRHRWNVRTWEFQEVMASYVQSVQALHVDCRAFQCSVCIGTNPRVETFNSPCMYQPS